MDPRQLYPYNQHPLGSNNVRTLLVKRSHSLHDEIVCGMEVVSLSADDANYEALSYTYLSAVFSCQIRRSLFVAVGNSSEEIFLMRSEDFVPPMRLSGFGSMHFVSIS